MSTPTYAYAANNPITFTDPDGLTIVFDPTDANLVKAISRLKSTRTGLAIWDRLDARKETIALSSEAHKYDPKTDSYKFGRTPKSTGNQTCFVESDPAWEDTRTDPAATIGHEFSHAESNLAPVPMSRAASETRAQAIQALIRLQLP